MAGIFLAGQELFSIWDRYNEPSKTDSNEAVMLDAVTKEPYLIEGTNFVFDFPGYPKNYDYYGGCLCSCTSGWWEVVREGTTGFQSSGDLNWYLSLPADRAGELPSANCNLYEGGPIYDTSNCYATTPNVIPKHYGQPIEEPAWSGQCCFVGNQAKHHADRFWVWIDGKLWTNEIDYLLPGQHDIELVYWAKHCHNTYPDCGRYVCGGEERYDKMKVYVNPKECTLNAGEYLVYQAFGAGQSIYKIDDTHYNNFALSVSKFCNIHPTIIVDATTLTSSVDYTFYYKMQKGETVIVPSNNIYGMFYVTPDYVPIGCQQDQAWNADYENCIGTTGIISVCVPPAVWNAETSVCEITTEVVQQCFNDADCTSPCIGMTTKCEQNICTYYNDCLIPPVGASIWDYINAVWTTFWNFVKSLVGV